jgi:hypothetical protein
MYNTAFVPFFKGSIQDTHGLQLPEGGDFTTKLHSENCISNI